MVDKKLFRCLAVGASALFLAVAAHAQVLVEDTDKPGNSGALQSGQSTQPGTSRLQQGVMQSSERQSGTQRTGMENGSRPLGPTQSAVTQAGATQAGTTQSGHPTLRDPANVPSAYERSRQAEDAQSGVSPETLRGSTGAAATAVGPGALSAADSRALKDMAMANMAEVEMGKMAQAKGSSEQVKTFGQQMIDDHGKALAEVQALAQAKGVTLPAELDAKHKREARRLEGKSGAAFDKAYMEHAGVKDHKAVHGKLSRIESQAKDADVKALAARMKPVVQQHLTSAQQITRARTTSKPGTESGNR